MSQFTEREIARIASSLTGAQYSEKEREMLARKRLKQRLGSQFTEGEFQRYMNSGFNPFRGQQ